MRRSLLALGTLVPIVAVLAVILRRPHAPEEAPPPPDPMAIAHTVRTPEPKPSAPPLDGLDLTKIRASGDVATASLGEKKVAKLTIEPELQRTTERLMASYHLPEAAVVLMDVATGNVLVHASHVERGPARDLCVEATAPAASVFKIVTSSALVENAKLSPSHRECYSGGTSRIFERDLKPDPKRDRACTTLAGALGHSTNTVFARLALWHLKPKVLGAMAARLQFNTPLAFDVPVQESTLDLPDDSLGYARTAAGFWNSTLSPLHAAWISATVARGGEAVRPRIVTDVESGGQIVWSAPKSSGGRRALDPSTARAVQAMMDETVSSGTSYKAFHDRRGASFLGDVVVAGKTGTLTDAAASRFYTWFTGFSHPRAGERPSDKAPRSVAISVLVVNGPTWTIKANTLAREVLRAYFAKEKVPHVTPPPLHVVADKGKKSSPRPRRAAKKPR